eukprot:1180334-Prorocentrum_minimum.AAC.2
MLLNSVCTIGWRVFRSSVGSARNGSCVGGKLSARCQTNSLGGMKFGECMSICDMSRSRVRMCETCRLPPRRSTRMSGQKAERLVGTPPRTRSAGVAGESGTIASAVRQANEAAQLLFTANSSSNSTVK